MHAVVLVLNKIILYIFLYTHKQTNLQKKYRENGDMRARVSCTSARIIILFSYKSLHFFTLLLIHIFFIYSLTALLEMLVCI